MTVADTRSIADPASPKRNLLVIAPPGCGKTEILAKRAEFLLSALRPGQRILALTFSNKAKANLNERLVGVLGAERKRRFVVVRNFHGHAAEIIRSHGNVIDLPNNFEVPDKRTLSTMINPYLEGLSENDAAAKRSLIEDQLRAAKQGPFTDAEVQRRLGTDADPLTKEVEAQRQREGQLFYDDLLRHAQRVLRYEGVSRLYHAHYAAVLVDEFQDLSPQQLEIALRTSDASRTFVGDPLQGIYSWTGARPVEVERILRRICGEPLGLGVSYRSSPRVLAMLSTISQQLGGKPLASHDPGRWFDGGIASSETFASGAEEAVFIRQASQAILERQPSATIGVICRSGWRRKPIDAEFTTTGTPCTRWDLAVDDPKIIELIEDGISRLGGNPDFSILEAELSRLIGPDDVETLSDIRDALGQLGETFEDSLSIMTAVSQLRVHDEGTEAITPGVHLLNAHTGKGQQFDWVFIPGLERGNVPSFLAKGKEALEEEQRVLLVMLSRARHGVIITRAKSLISKKGKPYSTTASPWSASLDQGGVADSRGLAEHISRLPASF